MADQKTKVGRRAPGRPRDEGLTERRREEILAAATRVFAERGLRGTEVQEIADRIGVGKGTVYRYFPSKDELFLATVTRVMERLDERIVVLLDAELEVTERVRRMVDAFLEFFEENPDFVEVLILERAEFRDRGRLTFFDYKRSMQERMGRFHAEIDASGRFRHPHGEPQDTVFTELFYGTIFSARFTGVTVGQQERRDGLCDLLLRGILA